MVILSLPASASNELHRLGPAFRQVQAILVVLFCALAADGVGFFQAGACAIAVFPSDELAKDANVAFEGMAENFRGIALAWNCRSEHDVNVVIGRAGKAGAAIRKPAQDAFWGGFTIGLVQQLSSLVLPTQLQNAAIFVFFLLVVTIRPQGLFGRVSERT